MTQKDKASGFSKLSKQQKIEWLAKYYLEGYNDLESFLSEYLHDDAAVQKTLDGFSENTITNFPLPYGVAPHFVINEREYTVPLVIEESSVVAALSNGAKFWKTRGGIKAKVIGTTKLGHIYFYWQGDKEKLNLFFEVKKEELEKSCDQLTANMKSRGGGIIDMSLIDMSSDEEGIFKIEIKFETCDSMGANFINSILEKVAAQWKFFIEETPNFLGDEKKVDIIMRILSNYTPECLVRAEVSCPVSELGKFPGNMNAHDFATNFQRAVRIATIDPHRATTHNKGIYNGIDAVVIATGNDFRAVEACGHTYAARDGQYRGLSSCSIERDVFTFSLEVPLSIGTVGGLTKLHPLAALSLKILGSPSAVELMKIICSVGLMQNFAALRSLVTTGIQRGHMKMHLSNILNQLQATEKEFREAVDYFKDKIVSFANVRDYIEQLRKVKA